MLGVRGRRIQTRPDPRFGMSPSATAAVNATALQAAIDAVPSDGGELCIPTGSYNINAAPTLKTRLTISGCSDVGVNTGQTTRLVYSGAGALFRSEEHTSELHSQLHLLFP